MKRMLVLGLMVGLLAGQAFADLSTYYTFDRDTAGLLTVQGGVGTHFIKYVGFNPGTAPADYIDGALNYYAADMRYAVGFSGDLAVPTPGDSLASVYWGLGRFTPTSGTYGGFYLPISNDNQQVWDFMLYLDLKDTPGIDYVSAPVSRPGNQSTALLTLDIPFDFAAVQDIGLVIQFDKATTGQGSNLTDTYHVSVVPVPAAVLLGFLGLGAAGLKLRRFA